MKIQLTTKKIKTLKPEELKLIIESDKIGEYVIIDVRQPEEYEKGHIRGARLMPLGELESRLSELEKDKKIVTYCRSGRRGMGGAILLNSSGFKDIYNLEGGTTSWNYETLSGLPEEKPEFITGKEDLEEIYMIAMKMEMGAQEFYTLASQQVESEKSRENFQKLASVEEKHMKDIYELYLKSLVKKEELDLESLKKNLSTKYMEGGMEIDTELKKLQKKQLGDEIEILEIALENEYISYDFYKRMAGFVTDLKIKNVLHELAWQEQTHINKLLDEISKRV